MPRRNFRHSPSSSVTFMLDRGWAFSRGEFSDLLADVYDGCHVRRQAFIAVIQPRTSAQVEWATSPMVPDGHPAPVVSSLVMDDITRLAQAVLKRSRSRDKTITGDQTCGTIRGLREGDAKMLAVHLVKVLGDPATFTTGKLVQLFNSEDQIA